MTQLNPEMNVGQVNSVDVVWDAVAGDCGKGKVSSHLAKSGNYDFVARWAGGQNAGHTIYVNGVKYATHMVPSGIFHGVKSLIGPGCVFNLELLKKEIEELHSAGFDTSLIRISGKVHIVTEEHLEEDKKNLAGKFGTTSRGIAPSYAAKYARKGIRFEDVAKNDPYWEKHLFDGNLYGNILCEGAQGFWLDINWGSYPYVTSSECLPYAACSLGFAPKYLRNIIATAKAYDTRSGQDPDFPESLFDNPELIKICDAGKEFGTTTGRRRKVNYLNLDKLIYAMNIAGSNILVMSKCDILIELGIFNLFFGSELLKFHSWNDMRDFIESSLRENCRDLEVIHFSSSPSDVEGMNL
jgi:adenylosuccinate synthase